MSLLCFKLNRSVATLLRCLVCATLLCSHGQNVAAQIFSGPPKINAAAITGNYPGTPFLFPVATAGRRPMVWTASHLPKGLKINKQTGFITGSVDTEGSYTITVTAANGLGSNTKNITIVIGDKLALTPTMGWNSWNTFAHTLNEDLVKEIADKMVSSGMRDVGYQYINLDDFWQLPRRDSLGNIQVNKEKFPHGIKHLADYLHERGLKLGIYSDAANLTCGGVAGSYRYEAKDALDFASWGIDLLKYDYCHAPNFTDTAIDRYTRMYEALRKTNRSILFSICEWGVRKPWNWAAQVGGSSWRTTGDVYDMWDSDTASGNIRGIVQIADRNLPLARYAAPGKWNDPDMLIVGIYGKGQATSSRKEAHGCTDTEYRTHMSLWCMMAAPLICGNDLRTMNEFTFSTLTNPGIIAIDQDGLGRQCMVLETENGVQTLVKPLSGKSWAIAFFNRNSTVSRPAPFNTAQLGIMGAVTVTDVWNEKPVRLQGGKFDIQIPPHGCEVFLMEAGSSYK